MRLLLLAALAAASIGLCPSAVTAAPGRPRVGQLQQIRSSFRERVRALSRDPAHGNKITPSSRREGLIGALLEARGILPGPLRRELTGKSEFIDARGVQWDVKAFNSRFDPKGGGFVLRKAIEKLLREFKGGERVILDTRDLSKPHRAQLRSEIARRGWGTNILWFP